jgi:hypothetical protein
MKTSGGSAVYKGWDYRVVKNKMDESEDASHINEGISCPVANNNARGLQTSSDRL